MLFLHEKVRLLVHRRIQIEKHLVVQEVIHWVFKVFKVEQLVHEVQIELFVIHVGINDLLGLADNTRGVLAFMDLDLYKRELRTVVV